MKLIGDRLFLRPVTLDDVNQKYLSWLNDGEVSQYLESRFTAHTLDSLREFVEAQMSIQPSRFFAIILNNGEHIGNIKIGSINPHHKFADVGIIIGEKQHWGKGYASEAISVVSKYAFEVLKVNKLIAGAYSVNVGSFKAFEKAGYVREGLFKKMYLCKNEFVDEVVLSLNNPLTGA